MGVIIFIFETMATKFGKPAGFEDKAEMKDKDLITSKEENLRKVKEE